jgi:streptomycin 6-kinase
MLAQLGPIAEAQPWLASLPRLIDEVRASFGLRLDAPLHGGSCSWVAPAELPDGRPVIVKISWPHPEMYGEPAALRLWSGDGAARLIDHDPVRHALLLERCSPGVALGDSPGSAEERLAIGCSVLRRLWVPAPADTFEDLGVVTASWADLVEERMDRIRPGYDPGLVALAADLLRTLPGTAARRVVLHGDFNPGNVLASGHGWLAIDPKPMAGDPAYDPWPMLSQIDDPMRDPVKLRSRLALLGTELDLDPARITQWSLARQVESALWTASHLGPAAGTGRMTGAALLAGLLG